MNDRIEQLIQKSYGHEDSNGNRYFNKELFAELIVRECAEICLEANDHKNILRHFGVKE